LEFNLTSNYYPSGDQPDAIKQLVAGVQRLDKAQVLLGVTGSGKTFTMANVIQQTQRPALILSHNKTLAAQLYSEFKQFFPNNAVEYFVSYYDYYQPEAYLPTTNTYIEKDLSINEEIEKLRLSTTTSLLSGRRDLIVVSSVSCIYGMGNPQDFRENSVSIKVGDKRSRNQLLHQLVQALYARTTADFKRGNFRVKGDTVDIYLAYDDIAYRVNFFGDEIEELVSIDPKTGSTIDKHSEVRIYPANLFVTNPERQLQAIWQIQEDLLKHIAYMKDLGKHLEAKRLEDRVTYDLEMIRVQGPSVCLIIFLMTTCYL
jgi:excinuclease ABC subunit B